MKITSGIRTSRSLAENFMESYTPADAGIATVGPHFRLDEMSCPPSSELQLPLDHQGKLPCPSASTSGQSAVCKATGVQTTALLAIYPTHLVR